MLFNCAHPSTRTLTPELINREGGAYLHRMQWAADEEIGEIPISWNWLEGWNDKPAAGTPERRAFHEWRTVVQGLAGRRLRRRVAGGSPRDRCRFQTDLTCPRRWKDCRLSCWTRRSGHERP